MFFSHLPGEGLWFFSELLPRENDDQPTIFCFFPLNVQTNPVQNLQAASRTFVLQHWHPCLTEPQSFAENLTRESHWIHVTGSCSKRKTRKQATENGNMVFEHGICKLQHPKDCALKLKRHGCAHPTPGLSTHLILTMNKHAYGPVLGTVSRFAPWRTLVYYILSFPLQENNQFWDKTSCSYPNMQYIG